MELQGYCTCWQNTRQDGIVSEFGLDYFCDYYPVIMLAFSLAVVFASFLSYGFGPLMIPLHGFLHLALITSCLVWLPKYMLLPIIQGTLAAFNT